MESNLMVGCAHCWCTSEEKCCFCTMPKRFIEELKAQAKPEPRMALPTDPKERKNIPVGTGFLDYFPAACAEVAKVSKAGNDQHNPGQPLHHARGKSTDHFDTIIRHLIDRGLRDVDGQRHTAKAAWRILALLQEELEADGAPLARGAKVSE